MISAIVYRNYIERKEKKYSHFQLDMANCIGIFSSQFEQVMLSGYTFSHPGSSSLLIVTVIIEGVHLESAK